MANNSNKKYHWYVLALTSTGPKFVTKILDHKVCEWNGTDKPLELSKEWAKDMCIGLMWNGTVAYPVCITYELDCQPFQYDKGNFKWNWNTEESNNQ